MLFSESYLYQSVRLLECSEIISMKPITLRHMQKQVKRKSRMFSIKRNYAVLPYFYNYSKCKIFKLLIKLLFLRLFEPDQGEIKKIFYEIVNLHNLGDF